MSYRSATLLRLADGIEAVARVISRVDQRAQLLADADAYRREAEAARGGCAQDCGGQGSAHFDARGVGITADPDLALSATRDSPWARAPGLR